MKAWMYRILVSLSLVGALGLAGWAAYEAARPPKVECVRGIFLDLEYGFLLGEVELCGVDMEINLVSPMSTTKANYWEREGGGRWQ